MLECDIILRDCDMTKRIKTPLRGHRVGLIINYSFGYFRDVADGLYEYAHTVQPLQIMTNPAGFADPLPISELHLDGIIGSFVTPEQVRWVKKFHLPTINLSINQPDFPLPTATCDEDAVAQLVVDHFRRRGFVNYGFYGPPNAGITQIRGLAFERQLARHGLKCHHYADPRAPINPAAPSTIPTQLDPWLTALPKPVVILTMDQYHALTVIGQCQIHGLAVPEQVAVIACGHDPLMSRMADVPLAGVNMNGRAVGFLAATMLGQLIRGEALAQPVQTVPPLQLEIQRSADSFAVASPDLARALRLIHDHACDPINVPEVLRHIPVTRRWLERQFRTVLNRSIHDEIMRVRMERGAHLLRETELAVWQIADKCGFTGEHHFINCFHRHWQTTPLHYRRNSRPGADSATPSRRPRRLG